MYGIENTAAGSRLTAPEKLTGSDFSRLARELGETAVCARKTGLVAARVASAPERIETRWNGKESTIVADAGDLVVTTLTPAGSVLRDGEGHANTYAIKPDVFARQYERTAGDNEFGAIHRPANVVEALFLSAGFDILAPWGERQTAATGYLLRNGDEIYGNHKDTFEATYTVVGQG